jgi:hypothetical protein
MTVCYEFAKDHRSLIFSALRRLIHQHPALGVTLSDMSWVRLAEINLEEVVQFVKDDTEKVLERIHRVPFKNGSPLWRVVVIEVSTSPEFDVAFFIHHALGDGRSGFAFHKTFKNELTPGDSNPLVNVPPLPLVPSIEQAHPLPLSVPYIAKQVVKTYFSKSDCWTGPPIRAENTTRLRVLFVPVDPLLRLCREKGTTITAFIIVVIAGILSRMYPNNKFSSTIAMSFRRFTGTDDTAIVNYVSSYSGLFDGAQFSWEAVRRCQTEIKGATSSAKNQRVGLLRFVNDYKGFFLNQVGKKRENSFEISNVGVFDAKRVIFSQSSNVIGAPYVFSIATGKEMAIALTWQEGIISTEEAEEMLGQLKIDLHSLTN